MPVPAEYQCARDEFYQFLTDAWDSSGLQTTHQAFTMAQVFFRHSAARLEITDAIRFTSMLPVGLRALFIVDWDVNEPKRQFENRPAMTKEVQSLRPLHNFAPETAIHDVAIALRRNVAKGALDQILATLPQGAVQFWQT